MNINGNSAETMEWLRLTESNVSGGNVSIEDLSIQIKQTGQISIKEEIVGLPSKVPYKL